MQQSNHLNSLGLRWMQNLNSSSLEAGTLMQRRRYRHINQEDPNADAELVHLTIAQPQACEVYYNACGMIDRHNRCRQDDLD
jgi:hypothetical protein